VRSYIEQVKTDQLRIAFCSDTEGGIFVKPTVVDGVTSESPLFHEEIFGLVFSVTTFPDLEETIRSGLLGKQAPLLN
jgi:gamma-glutamyl-gamma-aminobutyraldehyde dehydrogenase